MESDVQGFLYLKRRKWIKNSVGETKMMLLWALLSCRRLCSTSPYTTCRVWRSVFAIPVLMACLAHSFVVLNTNVAH